MNQYDEELMSKYHTTTSGVIDVIEKYASKDPELRRALTREMRIFKGAEDDFGRVSAISDRNTMLPDEWWSNYGCSAPHLQKLAIRVLSQTCSASGCERNWSLFENVHSKKRNRLEHQRMNDIAYVHYNSRLEQRRMLQTRNYDPISLEDISKFDENWILEDDPVVLSVKEIELFRKGCVPNDIEINCNMDDDDLVIEDDEDNDMDASHSQGNDHTNMETAGEDANDGHGENANDGHDEDEDGDYDEPRGPSSTYWTFQYR